MVRKPDVIAEDRKLQRLLKVPLSFLSHLHLIYRCPKAEKKRVGKVAGSRLDSKHRRRKEAALARSRAQTADDVDKVPLY